MYTSTIKSHKALTNELKTFRAGTKAREKAIQNMLNFGIQQVHEHNNPQELERVVVAITQSVATKSLREALERKLKAYTTKACKGMKWTQDGKFRKAKKGGLVTLVDVGDFADYDNGPELVTVPEQREVSDVAILKRALNQMTDRKVKHIRTEDTKHILGEIEELIEKLANIKAASKAS